MAYLRGDDVQGCGWGFPVAGNVGINEHDGTQEASFKGRWA